MAGNILYWKIIGFTYHVLHNYDDTRRRNSYFNKHKNFNEIEKVTQKQIYFLLPLTKKALTEHVNLICLCVGFIHTEFCL